MTIPLVGSVLVRCRGATLEVARVSEARPRRLRLERFVAAWPRTEPWALTDDWAILERRAADLSDAGGWLRTAIADVASCATEQLWQHRTPPQDETNLRFAESVAAFAIALGLADTAHGRDTARLAALSHPGFVLLDGAVRTRRRSERAQIEQERAIAALAAADSEALAELQGHLNRFGVLPTAPAGPSLIARLEGVARGGAIPDSSWRALLGGRLRSDAAVAEGAAFLLAKLGAWDGHDDLAALASGLLAPPITIDPACPAAFVPTLDACDLPLVAIDGDNPHEIDDAVFAELDGDDVRWWIAIAAPGCWIAPNSPADLDARKRGASLYHPRYHAAMLDSAAVQQRGSLLPGARREALVLRLRLDKDGNCTTESLDLCWVRVAATWNYDRANAALAEGSAPAWLEACWQAAQRSESARMRQGAYLLYRADTDVIGLPGQDAAVRTAHQLAPARRVVSEAMVRAGMAVAAWLEQRGVAAPFRVNAALRTPELAPDVYSDPADVALVLRAMGPARLQPRAGHHDILGASAYLQIGSPLRRYGDLIAQHQVIASLQGRTPPFDSGAVVDAVAASEGRRRALKALERRGRRYFQLIVIARMGLGSILRAQIIDADSDRPRAVVPALGLDIELPSYSGATGDWIEVVVEGVEPIEGKLELRLR